MNPTCLLRLMFALLLLMTGWGHAEGGCPPGLIPASGTNVNSCVPIPPGYYNNQQGVQQLQPLPPVWANRYGAIATDIPNRSGGISINQPDRSRAEQEAVANCQSNGGSNCSIEISYGNGCVALVGGKTGHNAKAGPTIEAATQAAMKVCDAADTHCQVTYAACSPAVRIR